MWIALFMTTYAYIKCTFLRFTEKSAETLLRMLDSSQVVTEEAGRQLTILKDESEGGRFHISVEFLSIATAATLEEAILLLVVATFVFNLKVTRRLRNIQYFVEHCVMNVEAEVRPTESAMKELELLSKVK